MGTVEVSVCTPVGALTVVAFARPGNLSRIGEDFECQN